MERIESNTVSQQMLAIGKFMKRLKSDKEETEKFRDKVVKDEKVMRILLQQRLRQAQKEDMRRRNEFASLISSALQPSENNATFPNTTIATNPASSRASRASALSESLLAEYKSFEAMIAGLAGDRMNTLSKLWAQDVAETERKLRLGHKVALRNVKKVLGAEDGGRAEGVADEDMDGESNVVEELNYELLKGLGYAERGVKRMVKGLPKDEQGWMSG